MYYIYILFSETADKFYVGYTQSPKQRILKHNKQQDFNTFTRKFHPWKMVALFEVSDDKTLAIQIERFIKNKNQEN
jgi:putative endonuclease